MNERQRQMHIGVLLLAAGNTVSGWRLPEAEAGAQNYDLIEAVAKKAEIGKLDFVFLADGLNSFPKMHPSMVLRLEPLTLLGALTRATKRIGLAVTATTTYTEPYNLARMLASLDHLSGGRMAWNIFTGALAGAAANSGTTKHPPRAERYDLAELGTLTDPVYAMKVLSERMGHDLSMYPLDEPVPELPPSTIMQGHAITLAETARRRNVTLRELRDFVGVSMGHKLMCGTPEQIADEMEEWFNAGTGDGFNLLPGWFPGGLDTFVDQIVPVLQKRGF